MQILKVKALMMNKKFKIEECDFKIQIQDYDPVRQEILYKAQIPDHIYDYMPNVDPKYGDKTKFKKSLTYNSIALILNLIKDLSYEIETHLSIKDLKKEKKIFVRFIHSAQHERCNWTHGYMGENIKSSFQFFVGYKVMQPKHAIVLNNEKNELVPFYYTLIRSEPGAMSIQWKLDTNFQEGTKLEPLHFPQDRKKFEESYAIVDWSQEAEDFLKQTQSKFKELNSYLASYLDNMTNEKLEMLMKSTEFKMLSK